MGDLIDRQAAIERATKEHDFFRGAVTVSDKARRDELLNVMCWLGELPSAQPEIIRCKDCQYWNKGSCECPEHAVNCQDYYVGDIETEAEYFCGYADMREVTT